MTGTGRSLLVLLALCLASAAGRAQEQAGSIRGLVLDKDFDAPLGAARVLLVETGQRAETGDQGNYVLPQVPPGRYTLVFSKDGYVRVVRSAVVVTAGQLTDVDVALAGEFTDMEEFVVQDALKLDSGSEAALLELRFDSPALLDAISADLIGRAGASDAASALRLVAGASLAADGKSAVVRGLPDRYVASLLNGVRLPTAGNDKRAVELDQFPSAIIESIQVAKTFTPDQQGDASGGAVDVKLKGLPDRPAFLEFKSQISFNSQVAGEDGFLSYDGGGLNVFGIDDSGREQQLDLLGQSWPGGVGVTEDDAPIDHKWSLTGGGRHEVNDDLAIGGLMSVFYQRDSSFHDDGISDSLWVVNPGDPLTPRAFQGSIDENNFRTNLFDVTRASQEVQWGVLAAIGLETEDHEFGVTYLYTRTTQDVATLAEDTRGKAYFFPGHDPDDPSTPGHADPDAAPYLRLETLAYTERTTDSLQFHGEHRLPVEGVAFADLLFFDRPEIAWTLAFSEATSDEPDKRQFGSEFFPEREPIPGFVIPATHRPYKPAANFTLGNLQRIWKKTEEDSVQAQVDLKLPFEQWSGDDGFFKFGVFIDRVSRTFDQDTFSNFNDEGAEFVGGFDRFWSASFPFESHPITASTFDVDYEGEQDITAWYAMLSLPLNEQVKVTGGVRFESTDLSIVNDAEENATWFPPGSDAITALNPGDADVFFEQSDVLPSIGVEYAPFEDLTLRASYNETIARQTFRELTPIIQQEFLGGPIFIGNPELTLSAVENYDLRADWTPYAGGLFSVSWFRKDITDPIEYVQPPISSFTYTTAVNYPEGRITGWEFEARQDLGQVWDDLAGLTVGANATLIDSEVSIPADEIALFEELGAPMTKRDMTNAPEYLLNLFVTYDIETTGTQLALFYTVQGDTLIAGAGEAAGNFVPSIYATEYGTLNFSASQKIGEHVKLQFQAKNITNPDIETVYRSEYIDGDGRRTSFTRGVELSLSLSAEFTF